MWITMQIFTNKTEVISIILYITIAKILFAIVCNQAVDQMINDISTLCITQKNPTYA